jgi:hypothetical protein
MIKKNGRLTSITDVSLFKMKWKREKIKNYIVRIDLCMVQPQPKPRPRH